MSFTYSERGLMYNGGSERIVVVPSEIDGIPVRYLQPGCFQHSDVEQVILPDGLVEISIHAFQGCTSLQQINIPSSVTHIGGSAFQGCSRLQSITIPAAVVDIGSYAFDECLALQHVSFEGHVAYIGAYAFSDTALEHVCVPAGIQQLGNSIFFNCQQLRTVELPSTIEVIGACAFAGCISLQHVTLPPSVKLILDGAFEYCQQLSNITLQSIPTFIDERAFHDCPSILAVCAPLMPEDDIELYDDQRHIFQHNAEQLERFKGRYLHFAALFNSSFDITFTYNSGPDYRIVAVGNEEILTSAQAFFEQQQYAEALRIIDNSDVLELQLLAIQCYTALHNMPKALHLYRQIYYEHGLQHEHFREIGKLLLWHTSITEVTNEDLYTLGKNYISSL